ncbi:MAG: hypothetical protein FWF92_10225 [Oscillospiraceae bacterium]|nr:hypothetical protein [Oscillospiraceae bacterium]
MKYNLEIKIVPKEHYIKVSGNIKNIENDINLFYLNENFTLNKLTNGQNDIKYIHDKNKPHPLYDLTSRPVILQTAVKELEFEYDGYIPEITNDINQIDEDIVELSGYSGWYPKDIIYTENTETLEPHIKNGDFAFELNIELPNEYIFAANAEIKNIEKSSNITIYNISSYGDDFDIALFASNKVVKIEKSLNGIYFSSICPFIMEKKNTLKLDNLIEGQKIITELLGEPIKKQPTCFINRPRGGWGYARTAFVSMPGITDENDENLKDLSEKSMILSIGGDLHELSHFWWGIASGIEPEDWINESGAEFTMLAVLKDMIKLDDYKTLIEKNGYIKHINELESEAAICETKTDEWDARYVNRYEKTAIMYIGAEIRFGRKNLFEFLKEFYNQNKTECNATTDKFLDICEKVLGKDSREYFNWLLYAKGWKNIDIEKDILKY